MRLSKGQINKVLNYILFVATFFLQSYVDGKYIAYGDEPTNLKVAKYVLLGAGIIWGAMQVIGKKRLIFLRELRNVMIAIGTFLVVSLILIFLRGGDLSFCLELIARYAMAILYGFVLLNVLDFEDIYRLMVFYLLISIFGWTLQLGDVLLDLDTYMQMSFATSYSPLESHYFAPASMNCCVFFLYYKRNKWTQILSFLFAVLTFKRVQLVFAFAILLLPIITDPNRKVKKSTQYLFCTGVILAALVYMALLMPEQEWIVELFTGMSANEFTSGRSTTLRRLLESDYRMAGLGTTEEILGQGIEMELISIMLEMSFPVMAIFVCCYVSVAGRKRYAMLVMTYLMTLLLTGSALYNVFMWVTVYLFFGSVNYLKTVEYSAKRWRRKIRIRLR